MREKYLLSGFVAIIFSTLFSCVYEEVLSYTPTPPMPEEGRTEVKFSSNITRSTHSSLRLSGNKWETGDAIGIYMFERNSLNVVGGSSNVEYVTKKGGYNGNFNAKSNIVYFPNNGQKVRFMSYYPYSKATKGAIYKINISNQIPQSELDLLYCFDDMAIYDKNIETNNIPIVFKQQMAKIYINVRNGEGLQGYDLMNMKVYISGLSTKADFNLLTGKISNLTGTTPIYPSILIAGGGNVYSSEATVIPGANISNAKIVFTLNNGKTYTWKLDDIFEKGKRYTFNVIVKTSGITVKTVVNG